MLVKYFFKLFFEALSNFLSRTRPCCFVSFAATLIFYQSLSGLSSTFFIFLIPSPDRLDDSLTACISQAPLFLRFRRNVWYLTTSLSFCQQLFLIYFSQVVFQRIKGIKKYLRMLNGEGGIWTLAPRKRSTPLAGAPLQPLEYFSWISNSSDIVLTSLWRSFIIINSFWNVNWFFAFSLFIFSWLTCKVKFTFFNSPILLPCIQYVCILIWTQRSDCRSHLTSDIKIWTIPSWI